VLTGKKIDKRKQSERFKREANRHFRIQIKDRNNYLTINNKRKNISDLCASRRINKFKGDSKPRSNLVKDENVDLAD
jgi:hypothetical protein